MALTPTTVGDNPQTPGVSAATYIPDQLIAGGKNLVTDSVTIGAGLLQRGAVLGQITTSGNYILSVKTANDGSQIPSAVLADYADASGGAVTAPVYLAAEVNANALVYDGSWTVAALKLAMRQFSLFVKSAMSAADPT